MKPLATIALLFCSAAANAQDSKVEARILSAYHGLDQLPERAGALALICGRPVGGHDGMPVVFSAQLDIDTVSPDAFAVETSSGDTLTPLCATLRPAMEPLERRTVLLIGPFGSAESPPLGVEVVGRLRDVHGNALAGLRTDAITALSAGPSLVFAERFAPGAPGLDEECPEATAQAVLLTWEGGVTGPRGADLAEAQRTAISVVLENGGRVHPLILGDVDRDNHVIACLGEASPAVSVSVTAGFFHDPGDDANPDTRVDVVSKR
ncbi:MAG: hypothetical protein F4089_02470 [Gammaproteobacteria bacterium]|nr:hypothetical protein [Gammaproteobacteria bacterium]